MKNLDKDKTILILNDILEYELAGVVKYTHFALMVTGPNRLSLDSFFKAQATESLEACSTIRRTSHGFRWASIPENP